MAIYHCSCKTIGRSSGRSATAAAAYRAGEKIEDKRTGEVHDYTKKQGVVYSEILLPENVKMTRTELWNAAEFAETRKNSTVAREWEIALPAELTLEQQKSLARDFAAHMVERYGVAADVCIHAPSRQGDDRNAHAHILTTTRELTAEGFGSKTRTLDDRKSGAVEEIRMEWANKANAALEKAGHSQRIDHRSLKAQGIQREPLMHLGPTATAIERRGGVSERGEENRQREREGVSDAAAELEVLEQIQAGVRQVRADAAAWQEEQRREVARQRAEQKRIREAHETKQTCLALCCFAGLVEQEQQRQAELERREREVEAERQRIAEERAAARAAKKAEQKQRGGFSMGM